MATGSSELTSSSRIGAPKISNRVGERKRVEEQRAAVLLALIVGELRSDRRAQPLARDLAEAERRLDREPPVLAADGLLREEEPRRRERQGLHRDARRGPLVFGNPPARPGLVVRRRWDAVHHPRAERWSLVARSVLEPAVPEPQTLLEEPDRRSGDAEVRVAVCPGTDDAPARRVEVLEESEHGVLEPVGPAADRQDGAGNRIRSPRRPSRAASSHPGVGAGATRRARGRCRRGARATSTASALPQSAGPAGRCSPRTSSSLRRGCRTADSRPCSACCRCRDRRWSRP